MEGLGAGRLRLGWRSNLEQRPGEADARESAQVLEMPPVTGPTASPLCPSLSDTCISAWGELCPPPSRPEPGGPGLLVPCAGPQCSGPLSGTPWASALPPHPQIKQERS